MIGIVVGEDYVAFEFYPIFAKSHKDQIGFHKVFNKTLSSKWWGEWGFAFNRNKYFNIWVFYGDKGKYYQPFYRIEKLFKRKHVQ